MGLFNLAISQINNYDNVKKNIQILRNLRTSLQIQGGSSELKVLDQMIRGFDDLTPEVTEFLSDRSRLREINAKLESLGYEPIDFPQPD